MRARLVQLIEILDGKAAGKQTVDLAEWISFFSYDFMGDMAAGFELMRDGDVKGLWKIMESGIAIQSYTQHIPWMRPVVVALGALDSSGQKLREFVAHTAKTRAQKGTELEGEDISTYLLDEKNPNPRPISSDVYAAEATLAIVAGSDTTATSISCIFFYIVNDKPMFDRLRAEIDASFPPEQGVAPHEDTARLAALPFLNAVINEALRLQPPVPTGLQRAPEAGSGGKMVGSIFVSEGTSVTIPPYALHRDPRYFSPDPDRFWPDRWLKENVELNQAAFIPFSVGPMNCVGKSLAQVELRAVIATLVQRFDMDFEDGWDRSRWEGDLEDFFVFRKGALPMALRQRV
ncbi:hypothetical protein V5O48_008062 [Marasmius crinis-equi]|uniref:Cytochrome P450 n=1 Tax=Marasmius crinis-equi TaxID=585013 RepID=A0ABR3FEZ2_9AGAR